MSVELSHVETFEVDGEWLLKYVHVYICHYLYYYSIWFFKKWCIHLFVINFRRSGGGGVVKHLACVAAGIRSSIPCSLATPISEIGHLLFPSRDMTEKLLKRRKILKTLKTTQPTTPKELAEHVFSNCYNISLSVIIIIFKSQSISLQSLKWKYVYDVERSTTKWLQIEKKTHTNRWHVLSDACVMWFSILD